MNSPIVGHFKEKVNLFILSVCCGSPTKIARMRLNVHVVTCGHVDLARVCQEIVGTDPNKRET